MHEKQIFTFSHIHSIIITHFRGYDTDFGIFSSVYWNSKMEHGKYPIENCVHEILMPKDRGRRRKRRWWRRKSVSLMCYGIKLNNECAQSQWYHQRTNMILLNWFFDCFESQFWSILETMIRFKRRKENAAHKDWWIFRGWKLRLRMSKPNKLSKQRAATTKMRIV